ncbi:DNA-3-methyladenine glycosylase family protein [Cellulomonas timonensis]|uniref:DNA-3-methyladenine glycosylase family protein n=1 Tax=Cellulomonas timonensis TaxID=1689271 RepID=UPI0018FE5807|nr:DNA-3-methyladenine glycosylase 2 family protein [Cellulomonas timonensis]
MECHETSLELPGPVDARLTLAPLARGRFDPTFQRTADGALWRTTRMPDGPATCRIVQATPWHARLTAWGPGAEQALAAAPALLGAQDDLSDFDPPHELVRSAHRRHPGLRMLRTGRVLESLVPAILEQRVIVRTAHDAWRWLLLRHGTAAPGPAPEGMRVAPDAQGWLAVPSWDFHRAGVDPRRARTVRECASVAARLEEAATMPHALARARLRLVPGVGVWTAAETAQRAFGDPDAISVGDYHLAAQVGWALTGQRVDDDRMLELLEPFRPHRQRVVRLLLLSGAARVPRRGPRLSVQDHRRN